MRHIPAADPDWPAQTIIYFSKGKNYLQSILLIFLIVLTILFTYATGEYALLLFDTYFLYATYKAIKNAHDKAPQIIISEKGIQTVSTAFVSWKDVTNAKLLRGHRGYYSLTYDYPNGSEILDLTDLKVSPKTLRRLLILYQDRYSEMGQTI